MSRFNVRKVAVLGAGVMGAQIAAHLVNCKVPVVLFDLPAKEGPKNSIVTKAVEGLKKLKPSPLGVTDDAALIQQANYEEHLEELRGCDLIIEAIAERLDWKEDLYKKIAPFVNDKAILATNTSGLSITAMANVLPEQLRSRFLGIHFFNPPRYMYLVELIPTQYTDATVVDQLEAFVTTAVGKGVVRCEDSPNFIANRVGVAGLMFTMIEVKNFGLGYDVVDDLTGKKMGRASSGTYRTCDVVGIDTMAHVIKTLQTGCAADPFAAAFAMPADVQALLDKGNFGQKTKAGFYKKDGKAIFQFDLKSGDYIPGGNKADKEVTDILKKPAAERVKLLRESSNPQAQFIWAMLRNAFHYAAVTVEGIADTCRDVDLALRWGYGMKQGPFELWQQAGWKQVAEWVKADIDAGKAICSAPLPAWVFDGREGVHTAEGSWSPAKKTYVPQRDLPVYKRQFFREDVFGSGAVDAAVAGKTLFEDAAIRLWTLDDEVVIASIKSKMHTISAEVTAGLTKGLELAEAGYKGLVIWSQDGPFSAGADLQSMMPAFMQGGGKAIAPFEKALQDFMLSLRYSNVPSVAAMHGLALGGGCELAVHASRRVAAMESYVGLVEVGVGLIPGGGGLAYLARRAAEQLEPSKGVSGQTGGDLIGFMKEGFQAAAMAKVATSAIEAKKFGYLVDGDVIVPNKDELLHVAIAQVKAMYESGYRAPAKKLFPVAGRSAKATLQSSLINMRDGGFISQHDYHISSCIADVLTGGDVDYGTLVSEEYLHALERKHFCSLLDNPKTQERIMGMLSTGKPVRN
ncbi:3-hydroxyacyl-CoA dehydrogenase/enoyl-CoA hydratase family protein [Aquabacterium lacunae]|uniref:3-hydroxyacyl-CoA dehydrogenase/enoyl-CoA hydratase family protein n=1 Tax=Aquabacterium lacunae TaxID=2528630 RepID=A0A4Q9GYT8_9BURK|nr:3-hydroxyacyl-CoA dehydrogenase/enoyl-CoA hydratase family protein [Aquabacterium lacunae]TBO31391.1 3-hydroxyacyl-CoA dehydrogenase/enoyl-CoA hydratase family protein [Aquabacterium lacunae]